MPFELDRLQHREAWAAIDFQERRRIIKAVNRGEALPSTKEARLAVGVATNQMRFWRWAWILGPMGVLFQLDRSLLQVVVNAVFATTVLGALSYWFHRRASRARDANLDVASGGRPAKKRDDGAPKRAPKRAAKRALKPAKDPAPRDVSTSATRPSTPPGPTQKFEQFRPDPNTSRAKAKRRKKRR